MGGFPELFLNGSEDFSKRWRSTHLDRILKEDLLELEQVRNLKLIEILYVIFVVPAYSKNIARAILKEPKIYFYDIGRVKNDRGARFENVVALSLLEKIQRGQDLKGEKSQLYYVRDKDKREVDFLSLIDGKIHNLVEVKFSDSALSKSLKYFTERLNPLRPAQVVLEFARNLTVQKIPIQAAAQWLASL